MSKGKYRKGEYGLEYIGNILYDQQLYKGNSIVVCGAGRIGHKIVGFLDNNDCKNDIKCLCDRERSLWNTSYLGIEIMPLCEAVKKYRKAIFLVGGNYADEMIKDLIILGISRIHMLLVY